MDRRDLNLNRVCDDGGSGRGDGFIDRSKVRILLCENDADSSKEVLTLLLKCSYQVISVRSARQVIDALNAEGPDIDIILADLDLPMAKGMKMLKYITRDKDLRRIPVIMMSTQDEISIVVKCLRLGAADYLVKPLRTNELMNLWTHMWRRRRMLGLAEKNILSYEFDLVVSDPSDANTTSTTLFSDDTDDKLCKNTNHEHEVSANQGDKENAIASATTAIESNTISSEYRLDHGICSHQAGQFSPGPKRSELKIGKSSAFFTYAKSNMVKNSQAVAHAEAYAAQQSRVDEKYHAYCSQLAFGKQPYENGEVRESSQEDVPSSNNSVPDSVSMERSCTPPAMRELPNENDFAKESFSNMRVNLRSGSQHEDSGLTSQSAYPYCMSGMVNQGMSGMVNQVMIPKNLHDMQNHATAVMMPQYNHIAQCPPHLNGMTSFPCYPLGVCLQPGQMPSSHGWQSYGSSPSEEMKINKVDRREAALMKFRQKRKERCFDKKIRYVNRKRLAERRPRVRGQFVRKVNGVNVDLNGQPASGDYDEDDEDDDALASMGSTPEDVGSGY